MGQRTDARIRDWQEHAGIEPATGRRLETLEQMSRLAVQLIKLIELEKSGIRDGDGQWHGSDPIGGTVHSLRQAEREDLAAWEAERDPTRNLETPTFDDHFGVCPTCKKSGELLNLGRDHWFVCRDHGAKWYVGSNLFDAWRHEDEETWERNQRLLETYGVVEEFRRSAAVYG